MKKYVGAVVRKSSQLVIDEEIDHSENKIPIQKQYFRWPQTCDAQTLTFY